MVSQGQPTFSVVIPAYNVRRFLRFCVDSVLTQDAGDVEVIIVDDGSTDDTGAIADKYADIGNVHVIHKPNGGLSSARNAGIEAVNGRWTMFLDADDFLRPGAMDVLREVIKTATPSFVQFRYTEVRDYVPPSVVELSAIPPFVADKAEMFNRMFDLGGEGVSACTKLIDSKLLKELKFPEGRIHEDEVFTPGLIEKSSSVLYLDTSLYMYVQRGNSIIHQRFTGRRLDLIYALETQIETIRRCGYQSLVKRAEVRLRKNLYILFHEARKSGDSDAVDAIYSAAKRWNISPFSLNAVYYGRWLKQKIRNARIKAENRLAQRQKRKRLKYTDFSILSNNCWAGTAVYQPYGLRYNTPTVGCAMPDEGYLEFLENLETYLESDIRDIADRVGLYSSHYPSAEALHKDWERRKKRLNTSRLLVKMSIRNQHEDVQGIIERFARLPFRNKLIFSPVPSDVSCAVYVPELPYLMDETEVTLRYIDLEEILNSLK